MNKRNVGKFSVSCEFIFQDAEKMAAIFSLLKIIPVRAEYMFHNETIEYIAISDKFEEVPEGNPVPEYTLTILTDKAGKEIVNVEVNKK